MEKKNVYRSRDQKVSKAFDFFFFSSLRRTSADAGSPTIKNYAPCTLRGAPRRNGPSQNQSAGKGPSWENCLLDHSSSSALLVWRNARSFPPFIHGSALEEGRKVHESDHALANQRPYSRHCAAKARDDSDSCTALENEAHQEVLKRMLLGKYIFIPHQSWLNTPLDFMFQTEHTCLVRPKLIVMGIKLKWDQI